MKSIKYIRSDFVISDPFPINPPSLYVQIRFQSTTPPTYYNHKDIVFKEDMTDIFCELLSIKEPQTPLQNKETTLQGYCCVVFDTRVNISWTERKLSKK